MHKCWSTTAIGIVGVSIILLGGCAGGAGLGIGPDATGSLAASGSPSASPSAAENSKVAKTNTGNANAASGAENVPASIAHARALRANGDKVKALAALEEASQKAPSDKAIARELGFMALEMGKLDKSRRALTASLDASKPDWRTLSALGTVQASDGNQKAAQAHFKRALALKPDHVATLNNLALSYALEGDLAKAEKTLRSVPGNQSSQKVKENLMLVLALAGKYGAAEKVADDVMPKANVASNLAYVKSLTQKGS